VRILIAYADRVGDSMGGVGIRAVELARVLRDRLGADVTIAAAETDGGDVGVPVVTFAPHAPRTLDAELARADAVIAQPGWPSTMHRLSRSGARLIFDLYDPEAFGTLEHFAGRGPRLRALMGAYAVDRTLDALARGHHVMCAGERQRDLWLGAMLAAGQITPAAYDADPTLRTFLGVVPYGLPAAPPAPTGLRPREQLGIDPADEMVLWNGGLWSWLDAPTAIRAIARLRERRPRARLVFMGSGTAPPARRAGEAARELARSLGVLGDGVVFNDGWVRYAERGDWLLAADCAIYTHADHLETHFAYRTRVLDCFWARLPVVCTQGDELADRVGRDDLGAAVPAGDPAAVADAIERVLDRGRPAFAAQLGAAAAEHAWPRVTEPLLAWLDAPAPASPPFRRRFDRRPSQRLRSLGYRAVAGGLAATRVRPPGLG
jgi:glycosyltransferase involved in cell wall biosynthesis